MSSEYMPADEVLCTEQAVYLYPENELRPCIGKIANITEEYLAVRMSMSSEEYCNAPPNEANFQCAVTGENCVYRFPAAYRSSAALPEQIWYLDKPAAVDRQQHRRFVRVPAKLPVRVKLSNLYGDFKNARETTLVDISGNGVCFVSEKENPVGRKIALEISELPEIGTLRTTAIVKRCAPIEVPTGQVYHIGAYLGDSLNQAQQNKLIRSVFQLQRKYLERGMGI